MFFFGWGQFILIQFKPECGTAKLSISLFVLFSCCIRYVPFKIEASLLHKFVNEKKHKQKMLRIRHKERNYGHNLPYDPIYKKNSEKKIPKKGNFVWEIIPPRICKASFPLCPFFHLFWLLCYGVLHYFCRYLWRNCLNKLGLSWAKLKSSWKL